MSFYNLLDRYILLPCADLIYGSCVSKKLRELEYNDMLSADELKKIQNNKLQKLVKHCYETVPYYRRLFDNNGISPEQIKSREDLHLIPILTKQIIRDNYQDMFSTAISPKRRKYNSTGGSTGTPLRYCTDSEEWSLWKASTLRAWEWYGLKLGDKIFSLGGNAINKTTKLISFKGLYDAVIMRNHKYSSADVSDECMRVHYDNLMRIKPKAIRGYGSAIYIFAKYIERNNLPICNIKVVLTTAEKLMPEYRRKISDVFLAPVYDAYGAGDGGILAHECLLQDGLHVTEESSIIEITDLLGNVLPNGEVGNVCSTDLNNYAFPFIRYHVGDMAYYKQDCCSCGRQTKVIGEVMGRAGKLVYNKQGTPISPTLFSIMLYPNRDYHIPENQMMYNKIDRFQIRQDKNGDILILLKVRDKKDETDQFNYVVENYRNHFIGSTVSLAFVDNIPRLPSGKEDFCISEYTEWDN